MAYAKPTGYKYSGLTAGASRYKPNNGFISGNQNYAPGAPNKKSITYNFVGAPANASTFTVQDGPPNSPGSPTRVFTFTWGGSAGTGVIPLVAGGGTAAQAAVAAQAALSGQLTTWTVTVNGTAISLVQKQKGINPTTTPSGTSNMNAVTGVTSAPTTVLPGRAGRTGATLQG
jgi:hypothetical protein